jgi:4-amino-4-deoxy-L-arabinose transferase-like glycosyltransferase
LKLFGLKLIYWLLIFVFCSHIFIAAIVGNYTIWDECYYNDSAKAAIQGVASNIEHPPLVKIIVGACIAVGGDNWLMWRLPIILFSVVAVALTYLIARRFLSEKLSLFAVGLVSLSTVFMLVGSCNILDMPCIAFGLAGLFFALKGRYGLSGLLFGLSFLCKELAVVMFGATLIYLLFSKVGKWKLLFFTGVGFAVAFFGLWIYDLVWNLYGAYGITNPVEHLWVVISYQLKLNGVVRAASDFAWYAPWTWVSPFGENALVPLRWVWLESGGRMIYCWSCQSSWAIEYLTFPLLAVLPVAYWVKRHNLALLSWLWIAFSYLPWLIAGLAVKTEANFYIVYAVPFLAIGCAYLYSQIKNRKLRWSLACTQLAIALGCFIYYFPISLFS